MTAAAAGAFLATADCSLSQNSGHWRTRVVKRDKEQARTKLARGPGLRECGSWDAVCCAREQAVVCGCVVCVCCKAWLNPPPAQATERLLAQRKLNATLNGTGKRGTLLPCLPSSPRASDRQTDQSTMAAALRSLASSLFTIGS